MACFFTPVIWLYVWPIGNPYTWSAWPSAAVINSRRVHRPTVHADFRYGNGARLGVEDRFIPADPVEREVGQIGEAQKAAGKVTAGSTGSGPWLSPGSSRPGCAPGPASDGLPQPFDGPLTAECGELGPKPLSTS